MQEQDESGDVLKESSSSKDVLEIKFKNDDIITPFHLFFRDHTGTVLTLLSLLACYLIIVLPHNWSTWLTPFFCIHGAVKIDGVVLYQKDIKDICTVVTLIIAMTTLRHFLCHTILKLLAQVLEIENTPEKPQNVHKCEEQGWLVIYYLFSFSTGIVIIYKYIGFHMNNVWLNYPNLLLPLDFKLFYLTQCAFYFHLILMLFVEKHRKDMWQMFIHHLVTILLITSSYYTNFTRIGVVVFVIFDAADGILPASKICQYCWWVIPGYSLFILFTIVWVYTRHYLVIVIMANIATQAEQYLPLIWDPPTGFYISKTWSKAFFLVIFTALEILQILWLMNILKLIYRQLFKGVNLGDDRSCKETSDLPNK